MRDVSFPDAVIIVPGCQYNQKYHKMKFLIQQINIGFPKCKMRMGKLSELKRHPDKVFPTPMLLLYSKGGSVTHLTREVLSMTTDISKELIQIPLANSAQCHNALKHFKDGISQFSGLPECLSYCTVQDPAKDTKTGYNEKTSTTVWTHTGRLQLTSEKYMDMIEAFKPDMYHSLCDGDTNPKSTKKRALKSVDVTTKMFTECLERHNKSEKHLPNDKLRIIHGGWRPDVLLELVNAGVDVFDSSVVYFATQRGCAFTFAYKVMEPDELHKDMPQTENISEQFETNLNTKLKFEKANPGTNKVDENYEIDLHDKRYFEELTPISSTCKCLTCTKHTKSYIHHLITNNEMLASVLLMIHNLHHYQQFFEAIRESGRSNKLLRIDPPIS